MKISTVRAVWIPMAPDWKPVATVGMMERRARLLEDIRAFMKERNILEVDTPVFSRYGNPDPNLHSFCTEFRPPDSGRAERLYLHTSPEFPMKRLLAAGSGPIYQICKVFRDGEASHFHEPEFSMLEWYRPGFDHHALMDEITDLLRELRLSVPERMTYAAVFHRHTDLDPHGDSDQKLWRRARSLGFDGEETDDRAVLLEFLFSRLVSPGLAGSGACFIYDFPVCQAALARIRRDRPAVAERFELIINGIEIANGYNELWDYDEQLSRFEAENQRRRLRHLPTIPPDPCLLAALKQRMPVCAGVAVGIDRLLMAVTGAASLAEVVNFPLAED